MDRTTWGQINELFEAARRLPADEREAWVRAATADERVRSEVLSLLHAHEDDPWFVDEPAATRTPARPTPTQPWQTKRTPAPPDPQPTPPPTSRAATPIPPAPARLRRAPEPKAGGQFATYRLIREISRDAGRISFEAVATGSSAHPRVVLHVLTADARDPVFAALLQTRGEILAHLDHPGIPRLLDGGVTADGTAYLAFEYAAGDALDEWCRDRKLKLRDRVDRVLAVCGAVQYAHAHLVAHGNLCAANILVSADGDIRLLDCGVSALLDYGSPEGGAGIVRPHMSPEQTRGEAITAASDVYALGILLYTLGTGYPPYELSGQTPARARHLICETEPDVPSTVVSGREKRLLAGTLDRVILKALSKNPRERYATATALAADLRAWRDGRPASVSPATMWTRARSGGAWRAIRAAALALFAMALVAGAGFLGWQAYVFRGERDRARAGLAEAERRAQAAEERAAPRPVADLRLEVAAATNERALAERRAGNLPKAEALWAQAITDVRPVLDADPGNLPALAQVAAARASLGSLCRSQRRFEESLVHYREALRARERAAAADDTPDAPLTLAGARTSVARLLLDLVEVRPPSPTDGARLREAGALLGEAGSAVRSGPASPAQADALAEVDRQSERLRRLTPRRR
jgi:tetratricopeptide (TPR) repeat protein